MSRLDACDITDSCASILLQWQNIKHYSGSSLPGATCLSRAYELNAMMRWSKNVEINQRLVSFSNLEKCGAGSVTEGAKKSGGLMHGPLGIPSNSHVDIH